ncbi:uncharacterized protein [Dermacentor andersoni]|uniref:uncharacterized protein n=1 Tax=Dermacentor andersoni TaxID=34620 RepID=UPI00241726F0|nr:uncharacterized protein LOC129386489 [Dermacentor andersoni]
MFTSASSNKLSAQACMGCEYAQTTSKQKLKRPSSVKCGKRCFAAMAVTEDNTSVYVVFQSKHRGHDFELGGVFLSKSERAAIAGLQLPGLIWLMILVGFNVSKQQQAARRRVHGCSTG